MFGRKNKANENPFSESIDQKEGANKPEVDLGEQAEQAPPASSKKSGLSTLKGSFTPKKKTPPPIVEVDAVDYKFGIAERLESAVATKKSNDHGKRSPDLVPLSKEYESMRKNLRSLISAAKNYQESMNVVDQERMKMVQEIGKITKGSPLEKCLTSTADKKSVHSIYQKASDQTEKFQERYQAEVLDYVVEWEAVISNKVDSEQAQVKELRKNFEHYQSKVEGLRNKVNNLEKSGKEAKEAVAEKLQRNTEKLDEASEKFEQAAAPLCNLIVEVVHQGWKDLLPLVFSLMQFETEQAKQAYNTLKSWKGESLEEAAPLESVRAKDKVAVALNK